MANILSVLAASSQVFYQALVPSFGCNTAATITQLEYLRVDQKAFEAMLSQKLVEGDCVQFTTGSVVEGIADDADPDILRVQTMVDPPGYLAPSSDFQLKEDEKKEDGLERPPSETP